MLPRLKASVILFLAVRCAATAIFKLNQRGNNNNNNSSGIEFHVGFSLIFCARNLDPGMVVMWHMQMAIFVVVAAAGVSIFCFFPS